MQRGDEALKREEFVPHAYQSYSIQKIIDTPYVGMFQDMGLGKTVITLTALKDLKYNRFRIRKALVIAPKKVAESTWTAEASKWRHLAGLRLSVCVGTTRQRIAALDAPADVYAINRDVVPWLVDYYGFEWPFDCVVLDESTSFKNPQSKRFRALKQVRPKINRLILLTGTPAPNSLEDLWAQIWLLDGGCRLGRTLSTYRQMFFLPGRRNQMIIYEYLPKEGAEKQIYSLISDICISMKSEDYLSLPELVVDDIPVKLDERAAKKYRELEKEALLSIDEETVITAANAATLTGKLLQLCNGAAYDEEGNVVEVHDCKIEALMETVEQLGGQHALVYYYFKHDRDRILKALGKTKRRVRVYKGPDDIEAWNSGKVDILLAQPASCGYGLNLQKGGHHIIWFGLTWSLEEYQQANKRLHRQGQNYPVIVHRLVVKGGMDEDVLSALEVKEGAQNGLLEALKAKIDKARGKTA